MRAGEIDGRYIDTTPDLGAAGDAIPSASAVTLGISRSDGQPMTSADLMLAGANWPLSVDSSGLVVTAGFYAPASAAGVQYRLVLTVNKTIMGRLFIRDLTMVVSPLMG